MEWKSLFGGSKKRSVCREEPVLFLWESSGYPKTHPRKKNRAFWRQHVRFSKPKRKIMDKFWVFQNRSFNLCIFCTANDTTFRKWDHGQCFSLNQVPSALQPGLWLIPLRCLCNNQMDFFKCCQRLPASIPYGSFVWMAFENGIILDAKPLNPT